MFKVAIKRWWRGDEVAERLRAEHRAGIKALAEFVAERARLYCPYDASKPAGEMHLRDTIQLISEADGSRHHVIASAPWAESIEFGFRHWISHRQIPANPYMRKALNDGMRAMPQFLGQSRVSQGHHHGRLMGATFK